MSLAAFAQHVGDPETARTIMDASPGNLATILSDGRWLPARHLMLISLWLTEALAGKRKRLLIMMPPRHGKSELTSHWFPVWALHRCPWMRVILASYEARFSRRWGRRVRNTIESYPNELDVRIASDSRDAGDWDTTEGGGFFATGVGGPITGRGADILLIDDPVKNFKEAHSKVFRDAAWDWFLSTADTRLEPNGIVIGIMTRWHQDDLLGRILNDMAEGGDEWDVLCLPAIAERDEEIGVWSRAKGEPLWPERWSLELLEKRRRRYGEYIFAALYQQRPAAEGGSVMQRAWWEAGRNRFDYYDPAIVNRVLRRYISWDTGINDDDDAAYTVGVVGELWPDYRLGAPRDVIRDRVTFPYLPPLIEKVAHDYNRDGKLESIIIEDKATGTSAYQTLMASSDDWIKPLLVPFMPTGSKTRRGHQAAVWCKNGCVWMPHPSDGVPWLVDFESEIYTAPASTYMDQFDAFTQLVLYTEHLLAAGWHARGMTGGYTPDADELRV